MSDTVKVWLAQDSIGLRLVDFFDHVRTAAIAVWTDSIATGRSSYMHNKFAVRDCTDEDPSNDLLWVASYNPNRNELYADCALEIPNSALCAAYREEFNSWHIPILVNSIPFGNGIFLTF